MAWPRLIELHNSEHSITYNGTLVREIYYVEPYDAVTSFVAGTLGQVTPNAVATIAPSRLWPASHYLYNWCLATECEVVPYDPRSFSYMGSTGYRRPQLPDGAVPATAAIATWPMLSAINKAVAGPLAIGGAYDPERDLWMVFNSQTNRDYAAGAFVAVTYKPCLLPTGGLQIPITNISGVQLGANLLNDVLNFEIDQTLRTNEINAGIKLVTGVGGVGTLAQLMSPFSGIHPVYKETYQEITFQRMMLPPQFDITQLSYYHNCTSAAQVQLQSPTNLIANFNFPSEALKFTGYKTTYVVVPAVDQVTGNCAGYNRWLNLDVMYDWRTTISQIVRDDNGSPPQNAGPNVPGVGFVGWNHILAYPGTFSWISSLIRNAFTGAAAGPISGVAWYKGKYSATLLGNDSDPFPHVETIPQNVGAALGRNIFDPIRLFW